MAPRSWPGTHNHITAPGAGAAIRGRLWRLGSLSHFMMLHTRLRSQEHGQLLWCFGIRSKLRGASITYPSAVVTAPGASANLRPAVSTLGPLPDAIQCGGVFLTQPYILSPAAMTGRSSRIYGRGTC